MKVVVFAHTPPPHHGQSYMVQLMLEGLGGDRRKGAPGAGDGKYGIECYHVNARVSKTLEDVGGARFGKLFLMLKHCAQAIWCRYRYGASTMYYVPAPGKRAALYRDWLVMALCRPFFRKIVFHWHATSLAKWLETSTSVRTRGMAYRFMGQADLSIVLSRHNRFNAEKLWPRRVAVVPNGIPDPCPRFLEDALPRRKARLEARRKLLRGEPPPDSQGPGQYDPSQVEVLFLAHCTREKGLFDAAQAVVIANERLAHMSSPLRFRLVVAGTFQDPREKFEFEQICGTAGGASAIRYAGFVQGERKSEVFMNADLLCFPSHWENQPVTVIEALAFGLPTVVTNLPSVEEMLPENYPGVAKVKDAADIARAMVDLVNFADFEALRSRFQYRFKLEAFFANMAETLRTLEKNREPVSSARE